MNELLTARIAELDRPVSRLFFGTAIPPVSTDEPAAPELLDSVLAAGVNAFDCARSYGHAEEVLGRWMESRGCRDRVTVLTKCGDIRDGIVHIDRRVILDQLSRSLEALRTGQIDIYLLHRDDPDTPVEEYIDTLNECKAAGKFRIFGVSNWTRNRIEEANRYAESRGLAGFSVSSPNFGLTRQMQDLWGGGCVTLSGPENAEDRAWYAGSQMPVIAYSALGRGFFSGRFRAGDYEKARSVLDIYAQKGYLYEENMERLRRAEQLAERLGISVSEVAMRYIFSSPMNVFAVVSTTSSDRLRMNLRAVSRPLTPEEVTFLEDGAEGGGEPS
jgi:aryl-alcohol dehydrogenase-like predicted oxidoreductase